MAVLQLVRDGRHRHDEAHQPVALHPRMHIHVRAQDPGHNIELRCMRAAEALHGDVLDRTQVLIGVEALVADRREHLRLRVLFGRGAARHI